MDEETFRLMSESGCDGIGVAIESGSERVLKELINKPVKLTNVPNLIKLAHKYNLYVSANFVIGFPGETWEEIRQTLTFAESCGIDYAKIYVAQPLLGTRLYDSAKELGVVSGDDQTVDWRNGRINTDEFKSKELSYLRVYEWDRINFTDPKKRKRTARQMGVTLRELNKIRKLTRDSINSVSQST